MAEQRAQGQGHDGHEQQLGEQGAADADAHVGPPGGEAEVGGQGAVALAPAGQHGDADETGPQPDLAGGAGPEAVLAAAEDGQPDAPDGCGQQDPEGETEGGVAQPPPRLHGDPYRWAVQVLGIHGRRIRLDGATAGFRGATGPAPAAVQPYEASARSESSDDSSRSLERLAAAMRRSWPVQPIGGAVRSAWAAHRSIEKGSLTPRSSRKTVRFPYWKVRAAAAGEAQPGRAHSRERCIRLTVPVRPLNTEDGGGSSEAPGAYH